MIYMSYIEFKNVIKEYTMGEVKITALNNTNFSINKGELVVIVGPSGAGKTTALNLLGGMDSVTSGNIFIDGKDITTLNNRNLIKYRREDIGFVFQFYNLVQNLTALENVELATQICKNSLDPRKVLKSVGLEDRMNNFPSQLSGGEQQRLQDTARTNNITVIIITHNTAITPMADKVIVFKNGEAKESIINTNPVPVEEIEW